MTSEVQIFGKDKIKLNILQDILGGMIKVGFQLNNGPLQDYAKATITITPRRQLMKSSQP